MSAVINVVSPWLIKRNIKALSGRNHITLEKLGATYLLKRRREEKS